MKCRGRKTWGESKKKVHQNCMKVIMKVMKINGEDNMHDLIFYVIEKKQVQENYVMVM